MDGLTSKEQFSRLVAQYERLVYTVCFQLARDAGAAEDLTQETFLAAYLHRDSCPAGYERQWLCRIAANKAKDHLRSAWARKMTTPGDEVLALAGAPPDQGPEAQALASLGADALRDKVLALREPYRTPCRLCLLEGYAPAEAARLCRRPEQTLNAQLWRAKKMLRAEIEQERQQERLMERRSEDGTVP